MEEFYCMRVQSPHEGAVRHIEREAQVVVFKIFCGGSSHTSLTQKSFVVPLYAMVNGASRISNGMVEPLDWG